MGLLETIGRIGGNDEYGDYTAWGLLGKSDSEKSAENAKALTAAQLAKVNAEYAAKGMVNPNQSNPSKVGAQLLRAQFNEWVKEFQPIELSAMREISFNNPEVLPRAVEKATSAATGQIDTMRGVLSRSNAAMGVEPTAQQAQVSSRILNLDRATTIADAANRARENVRTQDEQMLLGSVPNPNVVGK
jgi:hypothetical protein